MNFLNDKKKRKIFLSIVIPISVLLIIFAVCAIYLLDYYHADFDAIEAYARGSNTAREELDDGTVIFAPKNPTAAFIFYPGGKVEHNSYEPLMQTIAENGVVCILLKMPFNLAVFDVNAADGIRELYPEIETWYIGGHSLGGSMAASYLSDNTEHFSGLILLGSYSTADISGSALSVLSIYGSEDKVMNHEKYEDNKGNLPDGFDEFIIDGGCHAYFGMYGRQDGDGEPSITCEEQIYITANAICEFIAK